MIILNYTWHKLLYGNKLIQVKIYFSFVIFKNRNWVSATNSNFLIPKSLQPNGVHTWFFKPRLSSRHRLFDRVSSRHRLFDPTELIVWNIWGVRHWVPQIYGLNKPKLLKTQFRKKIILFYKKFVFNY